MTNLTLSDVEEWLDAHFDLASDYFVRKADLGTVNKWLVAHGFLTVTQGSSSRRGSANLAYSPCVSPCVTPSSPVDKLSDSIFNDDDPRHRRSNSKKYLRHNFAKSKSKSVFRTCEPSAASAAAEARRSSFRAMRKYSSLPPSSNYILCLLIESKVRLPRFESITLDSKKEMRCHDEKEFFLDIVKDIANDLDLKGLTHKIIINLSLLLNSDGASLFIVQSTSAGKKVLVSKVFDVHSGTNIYPATTEDNAMEVPWGKGIIGHVADTGDTVNLQDASEDPRYNDEVDRITGYRTDSLLCMPVRNYYGEIIAVAQVVNKCPDEGDGNFSCFTAKDERVFETYLQFVGIAITNAQLMEVSQSEYERNRSLLEVVHDLFEEQTSLENVILKTLQRAQRLLKCERAAVLLLEDGSEEDQGAPRAAPVRHRVVVRGQAPPPPPQRRFSRASVTRHSSRANNKARTLPSRAIETPTPHATPPTSPTTPPVPSPSPQDTVTSNTAAAGKKQNVKFSKIFELNSPVAGQLSNNAKEVGTSELTKHLLNLAEQVASSGENLNIADSIEVEKGSGGNVRSMLAMPIRNRNFQIIGVAKIINKLNGQPFDDNDEQLFEAFTIFCGLGINNTLMYNELEKAMARQKVAIEVLSYHATASAEDVESLQREVIPEATTWNLGSLTFDDFSLTQDQMLLAAMRMFMDLRLVHRFKIESKTLLRWLITVKRNYRNVPYHNWRHAFNVAHNMFCLLKTCGLQSTFEDIEWLGMFVGCLCHDLDHRGTNNSFQEKTGSALALLYGTQNTMEQHHFNHAVMILNSEGHNIFSNLSSAQYSRVMNVLKLSILATDLSIYFQVRSKFFPLVTNGEFDPDQKEHRDILRSLLMTACDIAASTKPWDTQLKVAKLVTSEFFDQGDLEKSKLKITPPALMDRDRKHELPLLQMRWIKDICLPLFDGLAQVNPKMAPMRDGALRNMTRWAKLAASQENGLSDVQEPPDIPRVPDG
ncbi:dual 3',5'-cyclic-AMP and -GMP phosphodiesterase 11A-like isoform X2 [Penaeus japonicus]|uniref:dual 3',5'-cyclic-AMP and -GMP phosphodiesterase 11A-like isoform X2 n=1 Tax=Penaeus japonicus TaxID=27405 RepID=UPI001C710385|nr:dual 3',5'-cyclic-AMP and -GMP phosphodiesterase 11A-like isoform X2 [Penaeus japonicus]